MAAPNPTLGNVDFIKEACSAGDLDRGYDKMGVIVFVIERTRQYVDAAEGRETISDEYSFEVDDSDIDILVERMHALFYILNQAITVAESKAQRKSYSTQIKRVCRQLRLSRKMECSLSDLQKFRDRLGTEAQTGEEYESFVRYVLDQLDGKIQRLRDQKVTTLRNETWDDVRKLILKTEKNPMREPPPPDEPVESKDQPKPAHLVVSNP